MELREWQYMNKPAGSTTNNSFSGYKKRFEKLINYHINHASSELESITKKDIKDDGFRLSEHYDNGHHEFDRDIVVSYDKDSDTFMLRIFVDGKEVDNILRKGYEAFVDAAEGYMFLPDAGTPDYEDLLTESLNEWKLMNPPAQQAQATSSKTNKEKFKELTDYMIANANFVSTKKVSKAGAFGIGDYGFIYKESVNMNGQDFILTLVVNYGNKHNSPSTAWNCELYMDTQFIKEVQGNGMEELLQELKGNFKVPKTGSPEYKSLTESLSSELNEWEYINPPKASQSASTTSSNTFYKDKFKKLLDYHLSNDYHIKHGSSQGTVELLSEDSNKALFKFKDTWMGGSTIHETIIAAAYFKKDASWWILKMVDGEQKESIDGNDFNELVKKLYRYFTLPATNSSEYQALLEEVDSSIADDFKLYENLWD